MRFPPLIAAALLSAGSLFGKESPGFDGSPFSSFSYEGKRLVEPRITSVDTDGVIVTDKDDKNSITVPLDRALKQPELRMRAKNAIEAAAKSCGGSGKAPEVTVNADKVTVKAKEVNVQTSAESATSNSGSKCGDKKVMTKSERGQMRQNVVWAGLVKNSSRARDLSDEELIALNEKALPILELQRIRGLLR